MVHFFHEAGTKEATEALLREVASAQLVAWYQLDRLLTKRWADVFQTGRTRFSDFGKRLRDHDQYLQITFDAVKPEIEERIKIGSTYRDCPIMRFCLT
jgi:hypothetical protein